MVMKPGMIQGFLIAFLLEGDNSRVCEVRIRSGRRREAPVFVLDSDCVQAQSQPIGAVQKRVESIGRTSKTPQN
jgi:hypothetical protein